MSAYADEVERWRAARYRRLTAPDGWLALVGKYPLEIGTTQVTISRERGDVPLSVAFDGERARVRVAEGDERELSESGIDLGALRLEIFRRGAAAFLRVKDGEAPALTGFRGIGHFPVDPRWRIAARLVAHPERRVVELDYEGGAVEAYESPGVAVFAVSGAEQRLTVLRDQGRPRLFVLFKDETNDRETYGAGRFLYAALPVENEVVLDFNQAFNPPCALTPWVTCPLVPRENRLPVRIEAGETKEVLVGKGP